MESILESGSWIPPVIALIAAIGGTWWVQRSTGAREITEATKALLSPLTKRIEDMEEERKEDRKALQAANNELRQLREVAEKNNELLIETREALQAEKKERAKDRRRLTALEKWARALRVQVLELGGEPIPFEDFHPLDES